MRDTNLKRLIFKECTGTTVASDFSPKVKQNLGKYFYERLKSDEKKKNMHLNLSVKEKRRFGRFEKTSYSCTSSETI